MDLIQAIDDGDLNQVQAMIRNGANINFANDDDADKTPLHYAAEFGRVRIGLVLLQAGANLNTVDDNDDTPLMLAAEVDNEDFVLLLLEQQDIDVTNSLVGAVKGANLNIINLLLDAGADVNPREYSPLIITIQISTKSTLKMQTTLDIIKLLLQRGADINARTYDDNTPLMMAVQLSELPVINLLLTYPNLNLDLQNTKGNTALHLSFSHALNVVEALINAGANPFIQNKQGFLPSTMPYIRTDIQNKLIKYELDLERAGIQAPKEASKRAMLQRRMTTGIDFPFELQLPQRQLPQYIFARAAYDDLCSKLNVNSTKPQIQMLAKSLGITPGTKSKAALCQAIGDKLKL